MNNQKTPIWLDCDPGHDDVFPLLHIVATPIADITGVCSSVRIIFPISGTDRQIVIDRVSMLTTIGVSTVHGNASVEKVTLNCLRILRALNKIDISVHIGASRGLLRPNISAKNIHGESGLDGTTLLPELHTGDKASGKKAVLAMAEALLAQEKGTAILVATGSMTNVALLVSLFPEVVEWLKALVIMGGAVSVGNVTPVAEFNIWVINSAIDLTFRAIPRQHKYCFQLRNLRRN